MSEQSPAASDHADDASSLGVRNRTRCFPLEGQNCDMVLREYDRLVFGIDSNPTSRKQKFVLSGEMSDYLISEILDDGEFLLVCESKSAEANRRRADAWKALLSKFERKYPGSNITADMARRHFHYHRKRILGMVQVYEDQLKESNGEGMEEADPRLKFSPIETAIYNFVTKYAMFGGSAEWSSKNYVSVRSLANKISNTQDGGRSNDSETSVFNGESVADEIGEKERQPAMSTMFTVRLIEEVAKSKGILKCGRIRGEARDRKRAEWERIRDSLNATFGTSYSVMQIYKKVENVKGKVKHKLENMKITGKTGSEVFNAAEQFFLDNMEEAFDVELSSQYDEDVLNGADEEPNGPAITGSAFLQNITSHPETCIIKVDQEEESKPAVISPLVYSEPTSLGKKRYFTRKGSITASGITATPSPVNDDGEIIPRKRRFRPASPLQVTLDGLVLPSGSSTASLETELNQTQAKVSLDDFKGQLVNRLSQIPTERMKEVHLRLRLEIDEAYAQQIADEISNRFDEAHRDRVMARILTALDEAN